jgi:hypothetical protein
MKKRVAILQSNYIPWKGYVDLVRAVDEFILLDTVQYTRRDWRNRNKIKTAQGTAWLTIPVKVKGLYHQRICDTEIESSDWAEKHWSSFCAHYGRAPWFSHYRDRFEALYRREQPRSLSAVNRAFLEATCEAFGIATRITSDADFRIAEGKNERLLELCLQAEATEYLSGPAARGYLDEQLFAQHGIAVLFADYSGYPEYEQMFPPFEHAVTALDLLFNAGPAAAKYLKDVAELPVVPQSEPKAA